MEVEVEKPTNVNLVNESTAKKSRKRKPKNEKDVNKPKRSPSAYVLWLQESREKIKVENPGMSFSEIGKKAGEAWKVVEDKTEWEQRAAKLKEEYMEAMAKYKEELKNAKVEDNSNKEKKEINPIKVTGQSKKEMKRKFT